MRDEIFSEDKKIQDFIFDDRVATVFDDMLERSVPFYGEVQRMVVELAASFLAAPDTDGSEDPGAVYDVGCSTGSTLLGIAAALDPDLPVRLVGLEPSPAMRDQAAKKLTDMVRPERVEIWPDSAEDVTSFPHARVITMLYTMQFIRPLARPQVVRTCYESLRPGGCLILAEKTLAEDADLRRLFIDLYHDYKHRAGYTSTEILRKREALENVLIPFTAAENLGLLRSAGFTVAEPFFQWYNFMAYLAVKPRPER
jgi:tRNA (cmo5U34)-methyltransferase